MRRRISSRVTTVSGAQTRSSSSGMNSIKRTTTPSSLANEIHYAFAQQRLAPGDANLGDAQARQHSSHSQVVRERQVAIQSAFVAGAAVDALVITAVRDRNP